MIALYISSGHDSFLQLSFEKELKIARAFSLSSVHFVFAKTMDPERQYSVRDDSSFISIFQHYYADIVRAEIDTSAIE